MKKKLLFLFVAFITFVMYSSCDKEEIPNKSSDVFYWENYDWFSLASEQCYLDIVLDTDSTLDKSEAIRVFYDSLFLIENYTYPVPKEISEAEYDLYTRIRMELDSFPLSSDILWLRIDSFQDDSTFCSLSFEEKERVAIFAHSIMGVSAALSNIIGQKQPPRTSYNNRNGDSRFERQLSSCLQYQMDGHFETTLGTIQYIAGLPWSFLWDNAICGEEIMSGLWSHVK
ncbi:MAG: hypothetical protein K5890_00630 [Bacteroidales bacterium]|nr:hypothetical protein [Bacteroidales bacterium]